MKKCPYCAEEIQDEAIKCRWCSEFLQKPLNSQGTQNAQQPVAQTKWYQSPVAIIVGFVVVGPLVLPLVWSNKKYSTQTKIVITSVIITLTYFIIVWSIDLGKNMLEKYKAAFEGLGM